MNIQAMLTAGALFAIGARAQPLLTAYLAPNDVPLPIVYAAKSRVVQMLAEAGVRLVWRDGQPSIAQLQRDRAISVQLSDHTPGALLPGAVAFTTLPDGVHIIAFYDRMAWADAGLRPTLLAHAVVHEITHILQGIRRHSETGVLKANWTFEDYFDMMRKPLPFTPEDIRLIHAGWAQRTVPRTFEANADLCLCYTLPQ